MADETVEGLHGGAALGGAGAVEHPGAPGLGQRVQAQNIELGAQVQGEVDDVLPQVLGRRQVRVAQGRDLPPQDLGVNGVNLGQRDVQGLEGGVDDRHGAGQVEVLIHGGGELGRQGPGAHLLGGGVDEVGASVVAELVGPQDRTGQALPQGGGVGQGLLGELHGGAVVDGAQGQAQHGGVVALEQLGHHQGVAQ